MVWKSLTQTWHYLEKWAETKPQADALAFENERLSWGDFKRRSDLIAKALLAIGVSHGDRVAMLSAARTEFLTTFLASGKIGAMWLGLSPKFTLNELRYVIGDSQPTVLIALREFMGNDLSPLVKPLMKEFSCLKKVLVIGEPFEGAEDFHRFVYQERPERNEELSQRSTAVVDDDPTLLLYTSGSTGKPKGVVHTHKSIVENIKIEVKKFYFDEQSRALIHFPINHVAAVVELGFAAVLAGGFIFCMDRFDPGESLQAIQRERLTALGQVPAMFLLQFRDPQFAKTDFSSVKQFLWAGAAAPRLMVQVLSQIASKTGATLITGYGSTEVSGFVTYTEKGDNSDKLIHTVGKIAEPFELKIVGPDRLEVKDGDVGEVAVRGPFLMREYYNNPQATAQVMDSEGWYYTSDLGFKDSSGYVHLTGRASEMFKSGGENIYPREVEEVIESHDAVLFAAVIAVPDEVFQEVGWAFAMLQPGKEVTDEELRETCKTRLAKFKIPKRFFVRPLLPLLANGKIDKVALRAEVKEILAREQT
ncbi:class I adenylate-forming enzyme family protein [Desulfomonile tiedjei]|uniref:Acyl-CoA synthetase (AMP-forming)/AMP-acid ligase II n=1 Tax=Desulfomonile tiedjei (strain ATCC 49306 / DSM 6799 / DCB-1) TaxID=706587 RepID=I4C347_DESTA|nr:class I adenylate-forming enzyme family protein [Desulfomonile tiedjei]AFM23988.1 acyl-CoA synthetase (AMP-forming)/AMP-acid ligase II [Desulfomonile tiedjei DSM 6799]